MSLAGRVSAEALAGAVTLVGAVAPVDVLLVVRVLGDGVVAVALALAIAVPEQSKNRSPSSYAAAEL